MVPFSDAVSWVQKGNFTRKICLSYPKGCLLGDMAQFGVTLGTRMWAKAQRDGHPAEHRWRPLFNAAKFG